MRVVIHDYAGHPFQASLSRTLAQRGHPVTHIFFADNPGPKGRLRRQEDDPLSLQFIGISLNRRVNQPQEPELRLVCGGDGRTKFTDRRLPRQSEILGLGS
jgi:hypothetical protein